MKLLTLYLSVKQRKSNLVFWINSGCSILRKKQITTKFQKGQLNAISENRACRLIFKKKSPVGLPAPELFNNFFVASLEYNN